MSGLFITVANGILLIIAIPVFIHFLGKDRFGVWAIVSTTLSVASICGIGLNTSLTRFVSKQGMTEESAYDIFSSSILALVVGALLFVVGDLLRQMIVVDIFGVSAGLIDEGIVLLAYTLASMWIILVGNVIKAALDGLQMISTTNFLQLGNSVASWFVMLLSVVTGHGLAGVGLVTMSVNVVWLIVLICLLASRGWSLTQYTFTWARAAESLRKNLGYGLNIYAAGLVSMASEPLVKIMISNFLGVVYVGYYEIGQRLRNQLVSVLDRVIYPLFPLFATTRDTNQMGSLVTEIEHKLFLLVLPGAIVLIFASRPLIRIWLGIDSDVISYSVVVIVAGAMLWSTTTLPMYQFLLARGHTRYAFLIQANGAFWHTLGFLFLVPSLGYFACLVSYTLAVLTSYILNTLFEMKFLFDNIFRSPHEYARLLPIALVLVGEGMLISQLGMGDVSSLALLSIIILVSAGVLYKTTNLVTLADVKRFLALR